MSLLDKVLPFGKPTDNLGREIKVYDTPLQTNVTPNTAAPRGTPNKESTTVTHVYGNNGRYVEGLKIRTVDPTQLKGDQGLTSSTDKYEFLSSIYSKETDADSGTSIFTKAPWSLGNKYALFTYSGVNGDSLTIYGSSYKDSIGNTLMGGSYAQVPTVENIMTYYEDRFPHLQYRWSDFMYCKNNTYAPNNYMLTLRRFVSPVEDNIFNKEKRIFVDGKAAAKATAFNNAFKRAKFGYKNAKGDFIAGDKNITMDKLKDVTYSYKPKDGPAIVNESVTFEDLNSCYKTILDVSPPMAQAVTWFGEETGNNLTDILTFTYGQKWKTQTTETTTTESNNQGYTAQPFYQGLASKGAAGLIAESFVDGMRGNNAKNVYRKSNLESWDPYESTYPNFVVGPVNVINEMQTRDQGLTFEHSIKLTFEYKLKSYADINPKIALLDILANILVLTYDNANFWGGANRFIGASGFVAPRFGDDDKLRQGNFKGYIESVADDIGGGIANLIGDEPKATTNTTGKVERKNLLDIIRGIWNGGDLDFGALGNLFNGVGGSVVGNILGKLINKHLGTAPAMQHVKGMITGEATGTWHLVVGNPMNPIATIGNLILESSNLSFGNTLGYDDFPQEFKLEVSLKPARPRDKTEFESMFNGGKGRLYATAANQEDFLNLAGNDVKVYGAFQSSSNTASGKSKGNWWEDTPGRGKANQIVQTISKFVNG